MSWEQPDAFFWHIVPRALSLVYKLCWHLGAQEEMPEALGQKLLFHYSAFLRDNLSWATLQEFCGENEVQLPLLKCLLPNSYASEGLYSLHWLYILCFFHRAGKLKNLDVNLDLKRHHEDQPLGSASNSTAPITNWYLCVYVNHCDSWKILFQTLSKHVFMHTPKLAACHYKCLGWLIYFPLCLTEFLFANKR